MMNLDKLRHPANVNKHNKIGSFPKFWHLKLPFTKSVRLWRAWWCDGLLYVIIHACLPSPCFRFGENGKCKPFRNVFLKKPHVPWDKQFPGHFRLQFIFTCWILRSVCTSALSIFHQRNFGPLPGSFLLLSRTICFRFDFEVFALKDDGISTSIYM